MVGGWSVGMAASPAAFAPVPGRKGGIGSGGSAENACHGSCVTAGREAVPKRVTDRHTDRCAAA